MSRVFRVWLDSGASIDSKYEATVSLDELGVTSEQWDAMTLEQREDMMRDIAFNNSDWGFRELEPSEQDSHKPSF